MIDKIETNINALKTFVKHNDEERFENSLQQDKINKIACSQIKKSLELCLSQMIDIKTKYMFFTIELDKNISNDISGICKVDKKMTELKNEISKNMNAELVWRHHQHNNNNKMPQRYSVTLEINM